MKTCSLLKTMLPWPLDAAGSWSHPGSGQEVGVGPLASPLSRLTTPYGPLRWLWSSCHSRNKESWSSFPPGLVSTLGTSGSTEEPAYPVWPRFLQSFPGPCARPDLPGVHAPRRLQLVFAHPTLQVLSQAHWGWHLSGTAYHLPPPFTWSSADCRGRKPTFELTGLTLK